jgi:chaperonin GroEL
MPKLLLFDAEARAALGRGVEKLTKTIQGTLGPKGGNTIIDRPVGTPIISRDGVSIIEEIELEDLFENMGAQVAREVSMQTNHEAGDGTTTALILANAIIQEGFTVINNDKVSPIEVVNGIERAIEIVVKNLQNSAQPIESDEAIEAVAKIAANEAKIGRLVAQAVKMVGPEGIIKVELGQLGETTMELDEGASFDRGYLSHHMATDMERMEAVLENPLLLISDLRITTPEQILGLHAKVQAASRPLLLIAEEISGEALTALLAKTKAGGPAIVAVHPPEYGKWRKGLMEDIAIITGGQVLTRELGATIEEVKLEDLGTAARIRVTSDNTYVTGGGDPAQIKGRRDHVQRQIGLTEVLVDRDKLEVRLAKLSGGVATIRAGGVTPAERQRREQLIEDAINATRAALEEGVIPGGGATLVQNAPVLEDLIGSLSGGAQKGARIVQQALNEPLRCIAENCGMADPNDIVNRVAKAPKGTGFDAWSGELTDLTKAGIIDPVRTPCSALRSAGSIASLILTTRALVTDKPEWDDPTDGAARGGGTEKLDMDYSNAGVMA